MARARFELTLSLDAMISLEEKRHVDVFPLSNVRVEPSGLLCKVFSGTVVRWAPGHIHIFDRRSRALVQGVKISLQSGGSIRLSHTQVLFALEQIQVACR
jgi:hypothetical protein